MAWVKLTDDFTEHPKVLEAGPLAGWLWVSSLAWSNRNGTDGKVPSSQVIRLASFDGIGVYTGNYTGEDVQARKLADVLVDVGLWEPIEGGYLIHDYAEYQLTVSDLAARTEAKRRAGQAGGKARAKALAQAGGQPAATADAQAKPKPVSRTPYLQESSRASSNALEPDDERKLAEVWPLYADRKLKSELERGSAIGNHEGWKHTTAENAQADHEPRARQLLSEYTLSVGELVDVLLSAESPRWLRDCRKVDA